MSSSRRKGTAIILQDTGTHDFHTKTNQMKTCNAKINALEGPAWPLTGRSASFAFSEP